MFYEYMAALIQNRSLERHYEHVSIKFVNLMKAVVSFDGLDLNATVQEENARKVQVLWMML